MPNPFRFDEPPEKKRIVDLEDAREAIRFLIDESMGGRYIQDEEINEVLEAFVSVSILMQTPIWNT